MKRNKDARWDSFDTAAYESHNYGVLREEDDWILEQLVAFHTGLPMDVEVVDVGTGPNLIPILAAIPRSRSIVVWEYSRTNVEWLSRLLASPSLPSNWSAVWDRMKALARDYGEIVDVMERLRSRVRIKQASIFDLPHDAWDAATMEFCAESITADRAEFVRACEALVAAVRPNGSIFATFMEQSKGYEVGGVLYPAVSVGVDDLRQIFAPLVRDLEITRIPIKNVPIRLGYTGMLMLTARVNQRRK